MSPSSGTAVATGPVWPVEPRTFAAGAGSSIGVLQAIRTGRHGDFERVVLELSAPFGEGAVGYVPLVRADPSYQPVTLDGSAFLQVVLHRAVARWPSVPGTTYRGPETVRPGYPTVRQVSLSGDFEAVLSVAIGLRRTAGFRVLRLHSPERLVVDVAEPPGWRMWPDDGPAQARAVERAFMQGHQPWRADPAAVVAAYARAVYGDGRPVVTRAGSGWSFHEQGSADRVTVRVVHPFAGAHVLEVADTR